MFNTESVIGASQFNHLPSSDTIKHFEQADFMMMIQGIDLAGVGKNYQDEYVMVYNEKFLDLDRATQDFIFLHEVGHCQLGHLEQMTTEEMTGRVLAFEYEADAYAAQFLGKGAVIKALVKMADITCIEARVEIIFRATRLFFAKKKQVA